MKLAGIFTDGMVLQRNKEIRIFGEGDGCGFVTFRDTRVPFSCENGRFLATLPPMEAGGPYTLSVTLGEESVTLSDVLVGDVFIASGQSNIAAHLNETVDIEPLACDDIRLYFRGLREDNHTDKDFDPDSEIWRHCKKENSRHFSAIGVEFARQLYKRTGVPVGILANAIGASRVDAWTPEEIVRTPAYREWVPADYRTFGDYPFNEPGQCYAQKVAPIAPLSVAGVLWYQGEANTKPPACYHYAELLETMIGAWRAAFLDDTLPFYVVQLPPYCSTVEGASWADVRAGQARVAHRVPHVKLITSPETGEARMIHPARKAGVALALVKAALSDMTGSEEEYSGPQAEHFERLPHGLRITFSHAKGLHILGDHMTDTFAFDRRGVAMTVFAEIEGDTLTLSWRRDVPAARVSMGWQNDAHHNLYNAAGYLASPFTYDMTAIDGESTEPTF